MKTLAHFLEILGGARPLPEPIERSRIASLAIGIYWAVLLLVVLAFAGRSAKFIYIDF
jgi:hypothetical protein